MYQVGEKIVIKNNAFKGSDDPKDFEWHGKEAEVIAELGDNCYEVYVEGMGNCFLVAKEMRANKARTRLPAGGGNLPAKKSNRKGIAPAISG